MKIGRFELDMNVPCLLLDGEEVRVGSRALDILVTLASERGRVVSRAELMEAAWPGVIVEDGNIDVHMSGLRKLLGADRHLIVTVARRGYRLAAESVDAPESSASIPGPLPCRNAIFVGRDAELDNIREVFTDGSVLTLTGTGGIGKTSLALEVAHRAASTPDEAVSFVDLVSASSLDDVLNAIANACGQRSADKLLSAESLRAALSSVKRLLVLDGAEHVISNVARIVEVLLAGNQGIRFLITSREPLRIRNEKIFKVGPLALPKVADRWDDVLNNPALQLFLHHAKLSHWRCASHTAEIARICDICRRLDGIPLALELAASRIQTLGVEAVRTRLEHGLAILSGGYRTAIPRHRGLRATLDVSFELLSNPAQKLFRQLHSFDEPFDFESMCCAVSNTGMSKDSLLDGIDELVSKSLVNVCVEGSEAMYSLFESTRTYAGEKWQSEMEERPAALRVRINSHADIGMTLQAH